MSAAVDTGDEKYTVYVGNLDKNTTEELLYELFIQAGPVDNVTKRKTWSYGFVKFVHEDSVPYSVDLMNGLVLFGRKIEVRAQKRTSPTSPSHNAREHIQVDCSRVTRDMFPDGFHASQRLVHNHHRLSPKYHPYEVERKGASVRPDGVWRPNGPLMPPQEAPYINNETGFALQNLFSVGLTPYGIANCNPFASSLFDPLVMTRRF